MNELFEHLNHQTAAVVRIAAITNYPDESTDSLLVSRLERLFQLSRKAKSALRKFAECSSQIINNDFYIID